MWYFLTLSVLCALLTLGSGWPPGPRHKPTGGEVWPRPRQEKKTSTAFSVNATKLNYKITGKNCNKVQLAIKRCQDYIATLVKITKKKEGDYDVVQTHDTITEVQIDLNQNCEKYPYFGMDESYDLTVSATSVLKSNSVWGIIKGMETFSQLFYLTNDFKHVQINETKIHDYPNYPHRALMLDTSRHYVSVPIILKLLDAMAMNKMNVFHWHITDDESFPYQSTTLPELSRAAYHSSLVYSKKNMRKIKEYASNLGIRILMEIDTPGHTYSWGVSHPEVLTDCDYHGPYSPPLNPIKEKTWYILKKLLKEVQNIFPDNYFHLGGDEVQTSCWTKNAEIQKYMKEHNITNANGIYALFYKKAIPLLKKGTNPVVWDDVFTAGVPLPKNSVVQVWRSTDYTASVLKAGLRAVLSAPYYLDRLTVTLQQYYQAEPRLAAKINNATLLENLIGGTACMWGEMMDDVNVLSRVWPRASAVAEVLWSETKGEQPDAYTLRRVEEHTCRMRRRRLPAQPASGPGFCIL